MTVHLVTGGTGTLGRELVPRLAADGAEVRVLSRSAGTHRGDLGTGAGLADALAGAHTVFHLAVGDDHEGETRRLVAASEQAGIRHFVFISIPGTDVIPFPYYRAKIAAERVVENSGLPYTVLRASQFHDLLIKLFGAQRRMPWLVAPKFALQPIDPGVVADRLAEFAAGPAHGRVPDIAGPLVQAVPELARIYRSARGWRRPVVSFRVPGALGRAVRSGAQLVPGNALPGATFEEYLAREGVLT